MGTEDASGADSAPLVYLVTYSGLPELSDDDRLLLAELRTLGLRAEPAIWDDPEVDWATARAAVVRSTWDYHHHHERFLEWADRAGALTRLFNLPETLRWNSHKGYLADLEANGVPVVPTVWLVAGSEASLPEILASQGWTQAVVKPAVSASGHETWRVRAGKTAQAQRRLDRLLAERDMMVQPFLASVEDPGERSLIFVEGQHTHTARRPAPFGAGAGEMAGVRPIEAAPDEVALAYKVLHAAGRQTLYARVDIARDDEDTPRLMEFEVIEPSLFLAQSPPATRMLAAAIARRAR
jgi:glutathione synthase/RimK-type ligase-like ATP-grasp enzyme